jgi:hypothetical protein
VAVHVAGAKGGLRVVSVIAAEHVAPSDVLGAAYRVATDLVALLRHGRSQLFGCRVCSLFDLPLAEELRWVITEEPATVMDADGREEKYCTTLPAWSAQTRLDLTGVSVGFPAAASALMDALGLHGGPSAALQSTAARFSTVGFEAASITALDVVMGQPIFRAGIRRSAHLRFGHPYAVVAVTTAPDTGIALWNGLPVFSAWITQPDEVHDPRST